MYMARAYEHKNVLVDFFHTGVRLEFQKNEYIIRPGDTLSGVFFIEIGLVKSYDITKYGEENLLVIRKAGELLGMTAAMTDDKRGIIYTAITPTVVWFMPRERFMDFLESVPEAALPLLSMVTDMYRVHSERILSLEYHTVRERLVSFLLTHARRFGKKTDDGLLLNVPLRHQDIASSICATRETTGREIAALERKGLITNKSLYITIHDLEALQRVL